jgi:hypothetical protein
VTTAADLLLQTAQRGELHHAVILHGPARPALGELAVQIAKALNCLNATTGDDCAACQRIERRIHPDVHFIEVAGERKLISIEQIRDLVADASLRPYEGRTKVFIIDPADALSPSGSNALLKTLEEPTRDTTFLMTTRSPDLLLPTIRSRSQSIFVGGEETVDEELAAFIRDGLARFAAHRDGASLLAIAAAVSSRDELSDAIALLGTILCDAAAGRVAKVEIDPDRLLAAADGTMAALRWLTVNADPRLLVEQALSVLVTP